MDRENAFNGLLMETGRHLNLTACGRTFRCCFVGFKPREYLIVEVPRTAEIGSSLSECRAVIGSFCAFGSVVRFDSSTIAFLKKPAWLLLISYPATLEKTHDLRSTYRAECSLPCTLVTLFNLKQYPGMINDISVKGCKCILPSISPNQVEMFNLEKKVLLEFELLGTQGRKRLFGEVLYAGRDGAKISLGIKFNGDDDEATLEELREYVSKVVKLPSW